MQILRTNTFKKDYKRVLKRGKEKKKLYDVVSALSNNEKLEARFKDHKLMGIYLGRRECHIEPDWLLIYKLNENELVLERTGSHADLFE
jgi:mRNA interferase YafQ